MDKTALARRNIYKASHAFCTIKSDLCNCNRRFKEASAQWRAAFNNSGRSYLKLQMYIKILLLFVGNSTVNFGTEITVKVHNVYFESKPAALSRKLKKCGLCAHLELFLPVQRAELIFRAELPELARWKSIALLFFTTARDYNLNSSWVGSPL